jgi:hypothetical protein
MTREVKGLFDDASNEVTSEEADIAGIDRGRCGAFA